MEKTALLERLKNVNRLSRTEQANLRADILANHPELVYPWWFIEECPVNVLIVVDEGLNFGVGDTGLSAFLTIFKKMETESSTNIKYKVTLGHRGFPSDADMQMFNPDFVEKIKGFRFDNSDHFTSEKYDQVWLFGFNNIPLDIEEVAAIDHYMNNGGGLFATGDHGDVGKGLCGDLVRVKDMRYWDELGDGEVSMNRSRRKDTNTAHSGNFSSTNFDDQRDDYPQNIHARVFGTPPYLSPHFLLAINPNMRPFGIIDIMPDHPHEGACKPEIDLGVVNPRTGRRHLIRTQNIAVSFVHSGNTPGMKHPTEPHSFPSISVFDGRSAYVGRIVVDSTWHHFVNMNVVGFSLGNYEVIEQYYKNITRWMTRKKNRDCLYRRLVISTMFSERIIEANTLTLGIKADDIPNDELFAIGTHAMDIVENELTPADALEFAISMLETVAPDLAKKIHIWDPNRDLEEDSIFSQFGNYKKVAAISIGLGIARIKDEIRNPTERITAKDEILIKSFFEQGVEDGINKSSQFFEKSMSTMNNLKKNIVDKDYSLEGRVTDQKGNPKSGLTVRAVDLDFVGENVLGYDVVTDTKGHYKIYYKQTDFIIDGKESGGADIAMYILNDEGEILHKSEVAKDCPKQTKIDVQF